MAPGHRTAASAADDTLKVQGATTAKPKNAKNRHAAVPSQISAPISFRLRRMFDRVFHADRPEGRLIANEVVPSAEMNQAIARCVENAIGSGVVSPGSNRKAMRQQTEPLEAFRRYVTTYAFEQAFCHLSDQLIVNLEKHWNAKQRKL